MHATDRRDSAAPCERFALRLEVAIRPCTRADLPGLEWYGLFAAHRDIFRDAFARQERGENLMLLAVLNGFPIGQTWIDLARRRAESAGLLWAVRVYPFLQGHGVGTRLLVAAEEALRERGFEWAEIGVEKSNPGARRLYERQGFRVVGELREEFHFTRPDGERISEPLDEWVLRKRVSGPGGAENGGAHARGPAGGGAVDRRRRERRGV
jgi:ribosomal protein S18 acetylase RimI-like enzyme